MGLAPVEALGLRGIGGRGWDVVGLAHLSHHVEIEATVLQPHGHRVRLVQRSVQQHPRQTALDQPLHGALQRARAELRVETLFGGMCATAASLNVTAIR